MNIKTKKNNVCCEDCSEHISDTTRHFQSEIHLRNKQNKQPNQQNNISVDTQQSCPSVQSASCTWHPSVQFENNVKIIVNENKTRKPPLS